MPNLAKNPRLEKASPSRKTASGNFLGNDGGHAYQIDPQAFTLPRGNPSTSTKTASAYYGYRYYNPETGRWLNRDPLGDHNFLIEFQKVKLKYRPFSKRSLLVNLLISQGLSNVYAFINNNTFNQYDLLGLTNCVCDMSANGTAPTRACEMSDIHSAYIVASCMDAPENEDEDGETITCSTTNCSQLVCAYEQFWYCNTLGQWAGGGKTLRIDCMAADDPGAPDGDDSGGDDDDILG